LLLTTPGKIKSRTINEGRWGEINPGVEDGRKLGLKPILDLNLEYK
jgi:hypothetical protein